MRVKHVLAVGVSVLLLCVSSWASVCELSCSLSHAHPVPKPTRGSSAKPAHEVGTSEMNALHSHCGHANMARPSSAANHSFESTSHCTNAPCVQVQTLSSPVNGRDGAQPGSVLAVLASVPAEECSRFWRLFRPSHPISYFVVPDTNATSPSSYRSIPCP